MRLKSKVVCMYGSVAILSPLSRLFKIGELQICSYQIPSFDHVTIRFISPYTSKNGILFVIFSFEIYYNFSKMQKMLSILGCLGDLDNVLLSKWRYKKVHLIFNHKLLIIRITLKLCMNLLIFEIISA